MYFSKLPNLEYDKKPIQFPLSETEYVLAKNFFRRLKISDTAINSSLYYNQYTLTDNDRLDLIAFNLYGSAELDWIILLVNNIIDPLYQLPIKEPNLYEFVEKQYENPESIHHYETYEVMNSLGETIQKPGIKVDQTFYNTSHKFYDRGTKSFLTKAGSDISFSVTNYEYEKRLNDSRREIYILKPELLEKFMSIFESKLEYKKSSSYIDPKTKRSGI
jgi:hypothetical protein